jgi:hypothetical protein
LNSGKESKLTLGGYQTDLQNEPSLTIERGCDSGYGITDFGFGKVYYDADGTATSSYFANITSDSTPANVTFSTNFEGVGLPSQYSSIFSELLVNVTSQDTNCSLDTVGGTCLLSGTCDQWSSLDSFYFQILFSTDDIDELYLRVPIMAFAVNQTNSCEIKVQTNYVDNEIILGGYFYNQFFVMTQNAYTSLGECGNQTSQLWNKTSYSYIGN